MEYQEIINKIKPELEKAVNYLKEELAGIRAGRPSPSLLEGIEVDCFGQKMPVKSLGMITMSDQREIIIQPWDISYLEPISKAIAASPLALSAVVDKDCLRIHFPPLSEDLRKKFVRLLAEKTEEVRQTIRHWRTDAWREIQDRFQAGEISEDDKYRAKDKLQELIDEFNKKIEEMAERKKQEIME